MKLITIIKKWINKDGEVEFITRRVPQNELNKYISKGWTYTSKSKHKKHLRSYGL